FARPVLAELAQMVESAVRSVLPPIERRQQGEQIPLSSAQQRLWFLAQMEGSRPYHIPMGFELRGSLDAAALRRALDRIIARHEALRTTFLTVDGQPVQKIAPAEESRLQLLEHDLRGHEHAEAELVKLVEEEAGAPFDL